MYGLDILTVQRGMGQYRWVPTGRHSVLETQPAGQVLIPRAWGWGSTCDTESYITYINTCYTCTALLETRSIHKVLYYEIQQIISLTI